MLFLYFLARAISALNQMNTSIEYYQKAILLAEKIKDNYLCSGAMNELAGDIYEYKGLSICIEICTESTTDK